MNTYQIPGDWTPFLERAHEPFTLSIVIVYNNMSAALRATQVIEEFGRRYRGNMLPRIRPVSLDHLHDSARFDRALTNAATSDLVIVSISGPAALPALLKKWIASCTAHKRENDSTVVALLGTLDDRDEVGTTRLHLLKNSANTAGFDFSPPCEDEAEIEADRAFVVMG